MSHIMTKPVFAICEQQKRIIVRFLDSIIPILAKSKNFKTLASRCGCAGRFESTLVANPKDRFSCDEAHIASFMYCLTHTFK